MTKLPVLILTSKVQSLYTELRSENWTSGRSSGCETIVMESIPNRLVGQVDIGSPAEVNFQGSSSAHSIPTRQQDEKTVLHWGCQRGATLILSPGVLFSVTCSILAPGKQTTMSSSLFSVESVFLTMESPTFISSSSS